MQYQQTKKMYMKNIVGLVLSFIFSITVVFAQQNTVANLIAEGVKLHDRGDYSGAIEKYKQALKIDKNSQQANYELASTYYAYKKFDESLTYCNKVIAANNGYVDQAYILKGSILDESGKHTQALKTYKEGIKKYTNNSLLYYNLALTAFNLKEYKDADNALMKGLKINPSHASSHLLLGYSMSVQGNRIKSILALGNFLMLEPTGKRAESALALYEDELNKHVKNNDSGGVNITVPFSKKDEEFSSADLMLSLMQSSNNNEANKGKSKYELLAENMKSLFSMLGELKKENKGFWWEFYVGFYNALNNAGHTETFCYYINQAKKDNSVYTWLQDNNKKYSDFSNWYISYKRN